MSAKLYVGNLSFNTDDEGLRQAFSSYGELVSASVITDRYTGRSRGFGFVEFSTSEDAQKATDAMNGQSLDGREIVVNVAREPERSGGFGGERRGGGGGGGFGGGRSGGGGGRDGRRGGGGGGGGNGRSDNRGPRRW